MNKIVTSFDAKPIPIREFDWVAYREECEHLMGWGKTREEAIADLLTLEEERDE